MQPFLVAEAIFWNAEQVQVTKVLGSLLQPLKPSSSLLPTGRMEWATAGLPGQGSSSQKVEKQPWVQTLRMQGPGLSGVLGPQLVTCEDRGRERLGEKVPGFGYSLYHLPAV